MWRLPGRVGKDRHRRTHFSVQFKNSKSPFLAPGDLASLAWAEAEQVASDFLAALRFKPPLFARLTSSVSSLHLSWENQFPLRGLLDAASEAPVQVPRGDVFRNSRKLPYKPVLCSLLSASLGTGMKNHVRMWGDLERGGKREEAT